MRVPSIPRRLPLPADLTPPQIEAFSWVCLLIAVNQIGFGMIVPVISIYAQNFGVAESAIGVAIAIYGLARFVVNVPAGRFADARGRRTLLALGAILTALGNAICAFAPTFPLFLAGRFISGAGAAMVLTAGQTIVADLSTVANRGRLMAFYQGIFLFSVGLGPVFGGWIATHYGLAAPFAANAAVSVITTALAMLRLPETHRADRHAGLRRTLSTREQVALFRAIPGFALVGMVSFSLFFARTGVLFQIIPLDAEDRLGLSPDRIGLALGMISVVGLILAWPAGVLSDRFGRKAVIVPATLIYAASLLMFSTIASWPGFLLSAAVLASSNGIGGSAPAAYAADIAPRDMMASALGAYRSIADSGYVIGPLVLGAINQAAGARVAYYTTAALLAVSGIAFLHWAPESVSSRPATPPTVSNHGP
ncbi:MAG: MFS transporter [Thermomicrobiales bacterium]